MKTPTLLIILGVISGLTVLVLLILRGKKKPTATISTATSATNQPIQTIQKDSGLKIEILQKGSGSQSAERGHTVSVHYTGWLTDGKKFDSSWDHGRPFSFTLGQGKVIRGWEEGIKGMHEGEKRRLTVPHTLGYGSRGTPRIPGRSTLIFEVDLLKIE